MTAAVGKHSDYIYFLNSTESATLQIWIESFQLSLLTFKRNYLYKILVHVGNKQHLRKLFFCFYNDMCILGFCWNKWKIKVFDTFSVYDALRS